MNEAMFISFQRRFSRLLFSYFPLPDGRESGGARRPTQVQNLLSMVTERQLPDRQLRSAIDLSSMPSLPPKTESDPGATQTDRYQTFGSHVAKEGWAPTLVGP